MTSILCLPRELRDMIWALALHEPLALRDAPASPAELCKGDRHGVSTSVSGAWGTGSRVRFEKLPARLRLPGSSSPSLRLVNRQLYAEVTETMGRKSRRRPDYHLDLVYLDDGSIWPTWTSVPVLAEDVGTVHATVRIFHCPPELETPGERKHAPFFMGDGSPPAIVWALYHTLVVFLECGPRPRQGDEEQSNRGPGMTMQKLVIDVLSATEPGIVHVAYPPSFSTFDRMRWHDPLTRMDRSGRSLMSDDDDEGLVAANLLARFLETEMRRLLGLSCNTFDYGCVLYEHIGEVQVSVNGESRASMDLAALLAQAPFREGLSSSQVQRRGAMAEWIVDATRRRAEAGLSLERPGGLQRRLLSEKGLLEQCMVMFDEEAAEETGEGSVA
ncbi:Putative transcriptional regulatory protein [Tolypocladium paradoxum]|uniref:Transcriptional regulatory protein n=1 Tax=Tolypocladium paradoxum TaxID=94208 RepID=A0A2S4KT20_9HYPO|nr:Putative transcriptional regulatory protein [Tolypocladium paradoxum]